MQSNPVLWSCAKCRQEFFDEEEFPNLKVAEHFRESSPYPIQPKLYWLGINEPVCEECAIESRIPAIDKE